MQSGVPGLRPVPLAELHSQSVVRLPRWTPTGPWSIVPDWGSMVPRTMCQVLGGILMPCLHAHTPVHLASHAGFFKVQNSSLLLFWAHLSQHVEPLVESAAWRSVCDFMHPLRPWGTLFTTGHWTIQAPPCRGRDGCISSFLPTSFLSHHLGLVLQPAGHHLANFFSCTLFCKFVQSRWCFVIKRILPWSLEMHEDPHTPVSSDRGL